MQNTNKLFIFILLLALTTRSVYSQPTYDQDYCNDCEAYVQSVKTTHWSVYIPIGIMVAALIWFGVADSSKSGDESGSKDGLGSLAHRHSHSKGSSTYSKYSRSSSSSSSSSSSHHSH